MTKLRVKITGEDADRAYMIQIADAGSGEKITDVESFDLHAHVADGIRCTLHRVTMKVDPETKEFGRFDSEAEIVELDVETYESE